ncbi:MAG: hypothetical protein WBI07_17130 [Mobilitalea sp.]
MEKDQWENQTAKYWFPENTHVKRIPNSTSPSHYIVIFMIVYAISGFIGSLVFGAMFSDDSGFNVQVFLVSAATTGLTSWIIWIISKVVELNEKSNEYLRDIKEKLSK